jgi:two-component system cell cycle response regulator
MVGKVLIIDDIAANRIILRSRLSAAFFQPVLATSGAEALRRIAQDRPDAVVTDFFLPDMTAPDLLGHLRNDPATAQIPVIVLASGTGPAARLAAFEAGADDVLAKPLNEDTLLARLRNLMRMAAGVADLGAGGLAPETRELAEARAFYDTPGLIAILSDRPDLALRRRIGLERLVRDRVVVQTPGDAMMAVARADAALPDVYLIDADLGGAGGGLRLLSDLRSKSQTRHAAVCLLHGPNSPVTAAMAFDLGASDIAAADTGPEEIAARIRRLIRRKRGLDRLRDTVSDGLRLAMIDPLTGLYNRRYALPRLDSIAASARDAATPFAVMVIDLDRFKSVNDRWGHAAGDAVLSEVAQRLAAHLRGNDLIARIGGEEFLVALPDCPPDKARLTAERLCAVVQAQPISLPGGAMLSVTVSIGLALSGDIGPDEPVGAIMERADQALLVAKANGRNKVTLSRHAA